MGSSTNLPPSPLSAAFLAEFHRRAGAAGVLTFEAFMALALYDPVLGYYRQSRDRVGYGHGTDFYTASTSGPVFGELVASAAASLLGDEKASDYTFVEIGAEPGGGILRESTHPFAASRTISLGAPISLSGPCIVFSNELFDAQPFRRFIGREGQWRETGVACRDGQLVEVELPGKIHEEFLPTHASERYRVDAPRAAGELMSTIASQPWHGLFIAFDYGKSWDELVSATPAGTARAYYRHTQSNDLLARPGEQDLTCHVCWDWLEASLKKHRFARPTLDSQEAFFIHHAGKTIANISTQEASRLSQRKLALMQLLHPAHLGQKFQVLHARRNSLKEDS